MKLDSTLVRNVMRDVTQTVRTPLVVHPGWCGTDPDGDRFVGHVFLGPNNQLMSDNDTQTGMMLDRVLAWVHRHWFRRFRAPLAHAALMTRAMMQQGVQSVIQRSQYPTILGEPSRRIKTAAIADDWDKLVTVDAGHVLSDDDSDDEDQLYDLSLDGRQIMPVKLGRSVKRVRGANEFRASLCVFFPSHRVPEPIVRMTPPITNKENPIDWACPKNANEAESLMVTENFWESVELRQVIDVNRIPRFQPGCTGVGSFVATGNGDAPDAEETTTTTLSFYLGPNKRLVQAILVVNGCLAMARSIEPCRCFRDHLFYSQNVHQNQPVCPPG